MKKNNDGEERRRQFEKDASRLFGKLFGLIYYWTHDAELAGDIALEAVCRFLNSMNERDWSQEIRSFDAFLTTTARNCLRSRWKAQRKMLLVSLDSEFNDKLHEEVNQALSLIRGSSGIDDEGEDMKELREKVLRQLLDGLTEYDKYLLKLHHVEDLSPKEIAKQTGKDVYWVRYQLGKIGARIRYRAKQYLKATGKKSFF